MLVHVLRITIMTDEEQKTIYSIFSSHVIFIHGYHWYQDSLGWKLWNKTALGAIYHVDQCLNFKKNWT